MADNETNTNDPNVSPSDVDAGSEEGREPQHAATDQMLRSAGVDVAINDASPSSGSTAQVNTHGIDHSEQAARVREVEERLRAMRMADIDPVTNQPVGDFFPDLSNLDEASQRMAYDTIKTTGVAGRGAYAAGIVRAREQAEVELAAAEAARDETLKANPLPSGKEQFVLDPATYRARVFARNQAEARALRSNTVRPGGCYKVDGRWVDAFGNTTDAPAAE